MLIGEVFRYPSLRAGQEQKDDIDGWPNYYVATASEAMPALKLDSGINQPATTRASDAARVAVIALSSSPHKSGQAVTPWQDFYDVDNGYARYFGDNKEPGQDPWKPLGNKRMLEQWRWHAGPTAEERNRAAPILLWKRVSRDGKAKGFVEFNGLAVLRKAELITQPGGAGYFTNYVYDLTVLSLASESERFDWQWITSRRDPSLSSAEANRRAPAAWKLWVKEGEVALPRVRRHVAGRSIVLQKDQRPVPSSAAAAILDEVYAHYEGRKAKFEAVAAWVTGRILGRSGRYLHHGVTRATGDRGFDFVGRLELGEGFGALRLVVLGQAKCEKLESATNAVHIARTVARLRRGWVGAFVTTSYFSASVQVEVSQDRYPLLLVNGLQLAEELAHEQRARGWPPLTQLLSEIERDFGEVTELSDPDQVLFIAPSIPTSHEASAAPGAGN